MKKIPTLFVRDPENRRYVTDEVTPGCEWVLYGEGVATRKYDGTCTMLDDDGKWWARREVKPGKVSPPNFVEVEHDAITGKRVGWEPSGQSSFAKFHSEAMQNGDGLGRTIRRPCTYELCGPKINGNPEHYPAHFLMPHADAERFGGTGYPRSVEDLRECVTALGLRGWEGLVWHHPDGRMAKLKARDLAPTPAQPRPTRPVVDDAGGESA